MGLFCKFVNVSERRRTSSWRRRRDSNPRYGFRPYNGLANRRLQPLGHVSGNATSVSAMPSTVKDLKRPQWSSGAVSLRLARFLIE